MGMIDQMKKRLDKAEYGFTSDRTVPSIEHLPVQQFNHNNGKQSFSDSDANLIIVGDWAMTLNTARKIEWAFNAATVIIALPFAFIVQILEWIEQPFRWVLDGRNWISHKAGHWLMHKSDAVKDGIIKNPHCLKHYTARLAWELLREAEKNHREADI